MNPQPNTVRYNDWRQVDVEPPEAFTPTLPVSVVVSYYDAPEALALTLASLEGQSYPRDLFEVVIVDDGSPTPLAPPRATPLDVKVVRQEDRGFGLARGRNAGARAAAHDILLFLDGDLLAESGWVAAHARWHHAVSDAVSVGFYANAEVDGLDPEAVRRRSGSLEELLADRPTEPPWVERHMRATRSMTSRDDDLFRMVGGGNCGVRRWFYDLVGGCDESFAGWGGEDVEFAYRAYTRGGLLAPAPDALAWHQGLLRGELREAKWKSGEVQHAKAAHLIAHPGFRRASPGRTFTVPQYVVSIPREGAPAHRVFEAAAQVLADRVHDLVVRVETREGDEGFAWLREQLGPDPRVRVASEGSALDEFPVASFHVTLPASVSFPVGLVHRLGEELGDAVAAGSALPDGRAVSITRTWALHRARRTGKRVADFGRVATAPPGRLGLSTRGGRWVAHGEAVRMNAWNHRPRTEWLRVEARSIDGPRGAWRFLKWLVRGSLRAAARWGRRRAAFGKRLRTRSDA